MINQRRALLFDTQQCANTRLICRPESKKNSSRDDERSYLIAGWNATNFSGSVVKIIYKALRYFRSRNMFVFLCDLKLLLEES
ncbi:hypothetical protein HNY73_002813 [Argiope bruennichi]|uniref:Uncharacterized protein n=1 Tax=Argiope bruennichi TaxID=94029 RepID=A0A8T0FXK0_ARGBR|nr:hypothetical protein HNY73_002813 [Argiope bruennichi]